MDIMFQVQFKIAALSQYMKLVKYHYIIFNQIYQL